MSEVNNAVYFAAASGDNVKLNELISDNGMLIDFKRLYDGNAPLHIAAIKGHISTVSILLQAGAEIDYHNQDGHSALYLAFINKHSSLVESLVSAGADATVLPNEMPGELDELKQTQDINWQEEDDIAHEIHDLLEKIDKNNISQAIKEGYKKKLDLSTQKLSKLFEKQKVLALSESDVETSLEALLSENPPEERASTPGNQHKENVVTVMLQKKAIALKKQLEVSDMKARSATLQWVNDKVKFKEEIEVLKAEKLAMFNKMAVMEKSIRLTEQLNRDKYMVRGHGMDADEEVSELDKVKAMLFESDRNLTEKSTLLAEVQQQYNELRKDSKEYHEKIEILQNRVDELLRSEESLHEMNDRGEKRRREDQETISRLKDEAEEASNAAFKDKERISELEKLIKEIKAENEAVVSHLRKTVSEMQVVVSGLVEQKEEIQRECNAKLAHMAKELEFVVEERNNLRIERNSIMDTLKYTAQVSQQMNHDISAYKMRVDKDLRTQKRRTEDLQNNLYRLQSTVAKVLDEARTRAERVQKEFDAYRTTAEEKTKHLETEVKGLKYKIQGLEFQVANAENLMKAAVAAAVEEETAKRQVVMDELNRAKIEIDDLYEKIKELKVVQQSQQDQLWTLQAEKRILIEEKEKLEEEVRRLNELVADAANDKASAGVELDKALAENAQLKIQLSSLKDQLALANEDVDKSKNSNKDLRAALDKANRLREEANNALEDTSAALAELQDLVRDGKATPASANVEIKSRASFIAAPKDLVIDVPEPTPAVTPAPHVTFASTPKEEKPPAKEVKEVKEVVETKDTKRRGKKKRLIEPDLPAVDIGMPDFTVVAVEHEEVVEEDQPIRIDISQKRVEALVKQSVVTDNFYFSKEADGFTNDYPIDPDFMNDLVRAFHAMCGNAADIVELSTTKTSNRFELIENLTQSVEDLVLKTAKDLVINMEKSKENAINAFKIEQMQAEMEGGGGGYGGNSTSNSVPELPASAIAAAVSAISISTEGMSVYTPPHTGKKPGSHHAARSHLQSPHSGVIETDVVAKYENQIHELNQNVTDLEERLREAQEELEYESRNRAKLEELYHEQQAEIDKLTFKDHEKLIESEREAALSKVEVCTDKEIETIERDAKQEELDKIANEPVDVDELKRAAEEGELIRLGEVRTENFERLKGKDFGPDFLVDLTIIEHHIRFDQEAARMNGGKGFNKMAMRSLEIQRDLLQKELLGAHTLLDFMRYKHSSEKYITMLDSMSVWRTITHDREGGIFRDVLEVHLDVINRIIDSAGGWKEALKLVNNMSDATISTAEWPEYFRVRALETLRLKLIKEVEDKKARLENCFKIIHQKNTEEYENKRGNIASMNFNNSSSDLMGQLQNVNQRNNQSFVVPAAPNNSFFVGAPNEKRMSFAPNAGLLNMASIINDVVNSLDDKSETSDPAPMLQRSRNKSVATHTTASGDDNSQGPPTPEKLEKPASRKEKRASFSPSNPEGKLVRQPSMVHKTKKSSIALSGNNNDEDASITNSIAAAVAAAAAAVADGPIETAEPLTGKKTRKTSMKSFSSKHAHASFADGGAAQHGPNSFSLPNNQKAVLNALTAVAETEAHTKPEPSRRPSLKKAQSTSQLLASKSGGMSMDSSLASVGEDDDGELGATFVPKPLKKSKMTMKKQGSFRGTSSRDLNKLVSSTGPMASINESGDASSTPAPVHHTLVRENSSVYKLRNALKHISQLDTGKPDPVIDTRLSEILKSLHANCDKVVLCALYEEEHSYELLSLLCEGIEKWYAADFTGAEAIMEQCLEYETTSNIIYDLIYICEITPRDIPKEVNEIYEKMVFIADYCMKRKAEREEEMKSAVEAAEHALMQRMNPNLRMWSDHDPNVRLSTPEMLGLPTQIADGITAIINNLPLAGATLPAEVQDPAAQKNNASLMAAFANAASVPGVSGGKPGKLQRANTFSTAKASGDLDRSLGNPFMPKLGQVSEAPVNSLQQFQAARGIAAGPAEPATPSPHIPIVPASYVPTVQSVNRAMTPVLAARDVIKPTMYDCAVQTVGKITTNGVFIADPAPEEVTSVVPKYPGLLPPTIICAYVQEGEFELSPGILFASTKKLEAALAKEKKSIKDFKMPMCVRYCMRTPDATYDKRLKLVPSYLKVPVIEGCDAVIFPPVYELQQGVFLLTNEKACNGINIELPHDVVVLHVLDNAELPRGLTMVELSPVIKAHPRILEEMAQGHQLVQIMKGTEVILPVGTEVSRGVRIAALAEEMELPPNVCIVKRMNQSELPDWMEPIHPASGEADESLYIHLKTNESCVLMRKPEGIDFRLGMEIIRRPQGMPLPPFMTLVPLKEYPERLKLGDDLELVQLLPRFDFPPTCKISPTWCVFPRPLGMNVPPGVLIVYPDPQQLPAKPLPHFACPVWMPDVPYGVKLPPLAQAIQLMHGSSEYALPEGAELAPGLTVVSLDRFLNTSSVSITRPPTPNVILVKRLNHMPLPHGLERGNREDLPPGTLLSEGMEIIRIPVRFELPPGVTLELGAKPGPCTQLAPGTILSRFLEVVQWPYSLSLNQGTELVRMPANYNLPAEYQVVVSTDAVPLPTNCFIVKLPHSVIITPPRVLAGKITVGIESMVQDKSLPLPAGVVFASRESKKSLWPAEILPLPRSALHHRMLTALNKINSESSIGGGKKSSVGSGMNIEAVKMVPFYSLPPGALIVEGVTVIQKPFWLNTPRFVELVHVANDSPTLDLGKGVTRIKLRSDFLRTESGDRSIKLTLPANCILVQLSEAFQPYSWGPYLPGVEAVNLPKGQVFLPPGHYLVERPLRKKGEELPPGFRMGLAHEFKSLVLPLLAPNVEVMHIVPTYQLPPGITIINSSVICKNSFNTSPIFNSGRFDLNWVPQICAGDYIASGCSVIKQPTCNNAFNDYVANDISIKKDPYVFVHFDSPSYSLPSNFSYHLKSNEIVSAVFGAQYVDTIKYILVANGLPNPKDRLKKDYGTARFVELQQKKLELYANTETPPNLKNVENLHIEVCRVLTSLDKASTQEEDVVNTFLTRLSVFRLNDDQHHEDYKILRNSKKFVMLDAGIQKIRDTCDSLDNANAWLKKQVENMMRERNAALEQKAATDKLCAELTEKTLYDGELRNIVHKLNEKLIEKTREFNELNSSRHELAERQRNQIEVLTTQLADWNKGKINPELEADLKKSQEFLNQETVKKTEAAITPAMIEGIEKQLHAINLANLAHLNGMTHSFNNALLHLVDKYNMMMSYCPPAPSNTAFLLLEAGVEGSASGVAVGSPGRQRGLSSEALGAMLADSHDTDDVDKMIANAVASRIKQKDLGYKPQSMTLSSLSQKHPATSDEEEYVSFSKSLTPMEGGNSLKGAKQKGARGPHEMIMSHSMNNLFTRMKKAPPVIPVHSPEKHSQVLAKLPTLMEKSMTDETLPTYSPRVAAEPSVELNAGSSIISAVPEHQNMIIKPSEMFKSERHETIVKADHAKVVHQMKNELSKTCEHVFAETNKEFSGLLTSTDSVMKTALEQLKANETSSDEVLAKAAQAIKTVQDKHQAMLQHLNTHLDGVSEKVVEFLKFLHDVERVRYVKSLQSLEHEIKHLNESINTCESHSELVQCFLAEAKSKNHEYAQNTVEGLRERIWILEHKIEKRIARDIQPSVSVVQAQIERIQEIMEIEKNLKFTALTLTQRASQEEAALREKHADVINKSDAEVEEMKKDKKAVHHFTAALRAKAKHYRERAERMHQEIEETVSQIMDSVQAYDRAVQAVIPAKLQSKLLKIGARYFEDLSVGGSKNHVPASLLRPLSPMSQSTADLAASLHQSGGPLLMSINPATSSVLPSQPAPLPQILSFDDQSTVGAASVVSRSSTKANNAAIAQRSLDEASNTLSANRAKMGGIGTMPAVTSHSHLALKTSGGGGGAGTGTRAGSGHNNRPALR